MRDRNHRRRASFSGGPSRGAGALASLVCSLCFAGVASAQEPPPVVPGPAPNEPGPDQVEVAKREGAKAIDRTWLYVDDAKIPAPLHLVVLSSVSYTNVGSPTRLGSNSYYNSLGMNTGEPGALLGIGGEMGLFSHVSIMTTVQIGFGGQGQISNGVQVPSPNAGVVAGVRVRAFPLAWRNTHLVVSAGYLREAWQGPVYDDDTNTWKPGKPYGDSGAWGQIAFSQDFINRIRLAATVHVEHIFADGRDPLDVMVEAGVSARIVAGFRLGAEYVGQDLEESIDPGAEGGPRHFIGPIASLQLLRDRLTLVGGPSFGLNVRSPEALGRVAAAFGF